jgi:predicted HicB family RNase H-like nuclease
MTAEKITSVRVRLVGTHAAIAVEAAEKAGLSVTQLVHQLIEGLAR